VCAHVKLWILGSRWTSAWSSIHYCCRVNFFIYCLYKQPWFAVMFPVINVMDSPVARTCSVEFLVWIVGVPGYSADYFRAAELSKKWRSSGPEALLFMNLAPAPELLVFVNVVPASVRIHTLMFWLSWCASSWMEKELNQVHKTKNTKPFWVI